MEIEKIIFENLLNNSEYFSTVIPHLKDVYFSNTVDKTIVKFIIAFSNKHNKAPNKQILSLLAKEYRNFNQDDFTDCIARIESFNGKEDNQDWLIERTEQFCRDKAIYNAISDSIQIIDGKDVKNSKESIPTLLQDALSISFDKRVGHDFFDNAEDRYDFYHNKLDRIPFRLDYLNKVTKNGVARKSLQAILASINVGKSLILCDFSASYLLQGYNVLYITAEMAEERIAERIDCNILDVSIDDLCRIDKNRFLENLEIKKRGCGKLIIKEYPTSSAHAGHIKNLLEELKLKKNFKPDVVCFDYINLFTSRRYSGANVNSYTSVKAIAEEFRGLMVEYNCVGWTATQVNKEGMKDNDFDMANTSESMGLPATLDMFLGIVRTEELDTMNQLMMVQLKSRYGNPNYYKRFVVGVDISKFKLHNVEDNTQKLLGVNNTKLIENSSIELDFD